MKRGKAHAREKSKYLKELKTRRSEGEAGLYLTSKTARLGKRSKVVSLFTSDKRYRAQKWGSMRRTYLPGFLCTYAASILRSSTPCLQRECKLYFQGSPGVTLCDTMSTGDIKKVVKSYEEYLEDDCYTFF